MSSVALITGANSGLGLATAHALAARSFDLIFLVRSREKGNTARQEILKSFPNAKIDVFLADLVQLDSVRRAAQEILRSYDRLDCLINNAGYAPDTIEYSADGYEKSFVANHLGHFLLTIELLPLLKASGDGRVISIASTAHALGKARRFFQKHPTNLSLWTAYGDGKLANVLFSQELARRLQGKGVSAYSVHPGLVNSQFGTKLGSWWNTGFGLLRPFMVTPEQGARTAVYLATAQIPESHNGKYFAREKPGRTRNSDINDYTAQLLWKQSEEAAGIRWVE